MSIIYEALKKIENCSDTLPITTQANNNENLVDSGGNKRRVFIKTVFYLVFLGLAVYSFKFIDISKGKENSSLKELRTYSKPNDSVQLVQKLPVKSGQYILEGVVDDGQSPFAIINGRVLRNYDVIDDYMITDISKSGVEMIHIQNKSHIKLALQF